MLPPSRQGQAFVAISPIVGGQITLPERFFVDPAGANVRRTVPSLSFLIRHPNGNGDPRFILFDLGLRSSISKYTEAQRNHISNREPYSIGPGVAHILRRGGYDPSKIEMVILSHVHYDHHGDPEHFQSAQFIVGPGTHNLLKNGLGTTASHQVFSPDLLPEQRTVELPSLGKDSRYKWVPLGSFSSIDLLEDGSIFVLNMPGHLPGHINLLCRVGPEQWVCLCGDSYHDHRLLTGERSIATWEGAHGECCCIHVDRGAAEVCLDQLRDLASSGNVELISAHDADWFERNRMRLFPSSL
ncbi:Metallo-hydrolase/oxidoreductase [Pleurostoma richardsiae]|uniref:Metallo-hydrolase/oxidoreductase n=1 Tax=Pleurostoma richardsiae TaxID=41990 RepID=A0AA38RB32_9PEZI|nr:Metallo-hydrolase/oxidoreductase [Pleurostoma richardsiae]